MTWATGVDASHGASHDAGLAERRDPRSPTPADASNRATTGANPPARVRTRLPAQLRTLAGLPAEVMVEVVGQVTQRSVLDALESTYPVLAGTIRDRVTSRRRAFIRFYVGDVDYSNASPNDPLPAVVAEGRELFVVVGAMAGG